MNNGLNYPIWKTHRLAARVRLYTGYIGCGCTKDGDHDPRSQGCARADFERLAKELCKRNPRGTTRKSPARESR